MFFYGWGKLLQSILSETDSSFVTPLLHDVGHQAQIVFDEFVPGIAVSLCHAFQALLLLLPAESRGEGTGVVGQAQGEKQPVEHQ